MIRPPLHIVIEIYVLEAYCTTRQGVTGSQETWDTEWTEGLESSATAPTSLTSVCDMATALSRTDCSINHGERSQLHATVSCAKLKRKKNWFGTVYVELEADGEAWRTAKSHSSSNPKWEERLTL
ncbi:hypothetical protein SKAU_G00075080 [Synaphobranchus kaupii]|uniref:C2 domain-containing protein n=1 Tax=Synaphobranchus kaupii TaxID=118154 RepID=A0A9Q1G7H6_SYNKA|nr:hypothetical protein SKAU_G00075080 [Synaphobranchus kaupii]